MYGATLTGSFADATGTACKVHFFVDTADRGDSNASAWAQHYVLENQSAGSFSRVLSGLTFNSTYRYRLAVENAGGSLRWTNSAGTFSTLAGLSAPTLGDVNASNTVSPNIAPAASTATLNGTLTATGAKTLRSSSFGGTMMREAITPTFRVGTPRGPWAYWVRVPFRLI